MTSLLFAAVRLAAVVALLIWLPGWIASRLPLRPWRGLHPLTIGIGIHLLALVGAGLISPRLDRALWIVPTLSFGIAGCARLLGERMLQGIPADPPVIESRGALTVALLVAAAALLRWFHNYHFDDLQHLFYLTEVQRENALFPSEFFLLLTSGTLPGLGTGTVVLSRYPYWAASYDVLSSLGGVAAGDAYFLLGLGVLAFTLAQMIALVSRAWSPRSGVFWVLTLVAVSPFVSDSLLNFGGYPFQSGKLFVLLAATSVATAWRTGRSENLLSAGVGAFVGPLLHTNNIVGAGGVLLLMLLSVSFMAPLRKAGALAACVVVLLGVAAAGSLARDGFIRWVPAVTPAPRASTPTAPATRAPQAPAGPEAPAPAPAPESLAARAWLFASRGFPSEIVLLLLATVLAPVFGGAAGVGERLAPFAVGVAVVLLAGVCAIDLGRQVVTGTMKPGYLRLRSTLLALEPAIDPTLPLLTDPITDVFGRAAGWRIPGRPPLEMRDQTLRVLLHHPAVTGHALSSVVASAGPSTLVIDEQVVGAGVSEKFTGLPGLQPVVRSGADVPSSVGAQERASAVVRDLYGLEFARLPVDAVAGARALYAAMVARPMVVFRNSAPAEGIPMTTLGSLLRSGRSADEPTSATWLSSAIVSLPATASCADGVDLTLRNRGSFQSALLVWSLDPLPGAAADATSPVERVDEFSTERTVPLRFEYPICGAGPITLLVHSSYWWDYRFDVSSAEWDISTAVE